MSDAKRFEDWIIFDAHEFQYPNGDSMSEDAGAFLLDLNDLRADATLWRDHVGQRQAVHDTWAIMEDEAKTFFGDVAALRGKWDAIPWDEIYIVCKEAEALAGYSMFGTQKIINWITREAPLPDKDALAAELEQIRRTIANIFPNAPKEPHA